MVRQRLQPALAATLSAVAPVVTVVTIEANRPLRTFDPAHALGAGVDGHGQGETRQIYTRPNLRAMRSAGLRPLTYRLRTELGVEAWHWNPVGRWSDPRHHQGYWTSSDRPGRTVEATYGYRLPRRGDTIDQANDDGYSRLDDGSEATFWKSNPYLDPHYTHEPEARHRQWIMLDLGQKQGVDGVRIDWAAPWARHVEVQYWTGSDALYPLYNPGASNPGNWRDFPAPSFAGHPGRQTLRLAAAPQTARFIRIVLTGSSHTALRRSTGDVRDRLGFAVRELRVGAIAGGHLQDAVRHAPSNGKQTLVYVSSTDPWHRSSDRDPNTEQPSFQTVGRSGLTSGQPMLTPVPVLYGTPEDAAGELRYLRALHIPVRRMELGEEPDGQLASPEDYGALYREFARSLHRVDPHIQLGGPGYETSIPDWVYWPDASGRTSWTGRFVAELRRNGALPDLRFFSFEWYPFDDGCAAPAPQLASAPGLLAGVLARQRLDGLPPRLPKLITEYGYSAFATQDMVDMPGAVLDADLVGTFLSLGGDVAYLYGYEPDQLIRELSCPTYGNLVLFLAPSGDHRIAQPAVTYWSTRLLTQDWTEPGGGRHTLVSVTGAPPLVGAYAVRRPDGRVAVLLVNRDQANAYSIRLDPPGPYDVFQLSSADYVWHPHAEHGFARPDRPPVHTVASGSVELPPWSVTVARTR